jgi:hypothetical protein
VFVTYTNTKKLAIGCLAIHDRSDDTSVPAACSAPPRFATSSILGLAWKQQALALAESSSHSPGALARLAAKLSCQSAYYVTLMISQTADDRNVTVSAVPLRSTALDSVRDNDHDQSVLYDV